MGNNDLRLQVAKALGWGFFEMDAGQGYDEHHPHGYDGHQFVEPPGEFPECVGYGFKVHRIDMVRGWTFADDDPDWPNDWNAAMELFEQLPPNAILERSRSGDHWYCGCDGAFGVLEIEYSIEGRAASGPEAICKAFLAWKGAGDGEAV